MKKYVQINQSISCFFYLVIAPISSAMQQVYIFAVVVLFANTHCINL